MTANDRTEETVAHLTDGRIVIAMFAVMVAVGGLLFIGVPGMGAGDMLGMRLAEPRIALSVDDFASRIAAPNAFLIRLQVDEAATIAGTDATIAATGITRDDALPIAPTTPILLYSKTGRISKGAAAALTRVGYTDVSYLAGGTDAWVAAGRRLR